MNTWPRAHIIACGILLVVSLFKALYHPLWWFALGAVIVGFPPIFLKSITSIRRLTLDMNILMAIGGTYKCSCYFFLELFLGFLFKTLYFQGHQWKISNVEHTFPRNIKCTRCILFSITCWKSWGLFTKLSFSKVFVVHGAFAMMLMVLTVIFVSYFKN